MKRTLVLENWCKQFLKLDYQVYFVKSYRKQVYARAHSHGIITVNPWMWGHLSTHSRERILFHEMAHILAWHRFGENIRPHGSEFNYACDVLRFRFPQLDLGYFHLLNPLDMSGEFNWGLSNRIGTLLGI